MPYLDAWLAVLDALCVWVLVIALLFLLAILFDD